MGLIIGLLVGGIVLLLVEVFLPGAVAGILGLILLLAGVVAAFIHDREFGSWVLMGVLVLGPVALWAWLRYFPQSRFGRPLMLQQSTGDARAFDERAAALTGRTGVAHTDLRPSGTAIIDGQRVDVITEGGMIEKGNSIRVVAVHGNRVIVASQTDAITTSTGNSPTAPGT